ncbi:MAG: hypothetical protein AB7F89_14790 [Pirellulaceae bacterium]
MTHTKNPEALRRKAERFREIACRTEEPQIAREIHALAAQYQQMADVAEETGGR